MTAPSIPPMRIVTNDVTAQGGRENPVPWFNTYLVYPRGFALLGEFFIPPPHDPKTEGLTKP